jgi:hypothetical protein
LVYARLAAIGKIGVREITEELRDKMRAARDLRDSQSHLIAERLIELGVKAMRKNTMRNLGVVSGETAGEAETFGNCNLFPSIQHLNGSINRAALGAYLNAHRKGDYARYYVVTGGDRVHRTQIRARWRAMSRRLSKFIHRCAPEFPWVEFVCRSNEVTLADDASAHPHFNVILIFNRYVEEMELIEFQQKFREAMKGWVRDAGRIRDIEEVIKYTTKYACAESANAANDRGEKASSTADELKRAVRGLLDLQAEEGEESPLLTLHHQLYKVRRFEAFGAFRDFRRDYKNRRLIPRRIGEEYGFIKMSKYAARPEKSTASAHEENKLISVTMPRPLGKSGTLIEPALVVSNYTAEPTTAAGRDNLAKLRAARLRVLAVLDPKWTEAAGLDPEAAAQATAPGDLDVSDFETGELIELRKSRAEKPAAPAPVYLQHMHDNCPAPGGRNPSAEGQGRGLDRPAGAEILPLRRDFRARSAPGHQNC